MEFLQQSEHIIIESAKYLLNTSVPGAVVSFRGLVMNKSQTALCYKVSIYWWGNRIRWQDKIPKQIQISQEGSHSQTEGTRKRRVFLFCFSRSKERILTGSSGPSCKKNGEVRKCSHRARKQSRALAIWLEVQYRGVGNEMQSILWACRCSLGTRQRHSFLQ